MDVCHINCSQCVFIVIKSESFYLEFTRKFTWLHTLVTVLSCEQLFILRNSVLKVDALMTVILNGCLAGFHSLTISWPKNNFLGMIIYHCRPFVLWLSVWIKYIWWNRFLVLFFSFSFSQVINRDDQYFQER